MTLVDTAPRSSAGLLQQREQFLRALYGICDGTSWFTIFTHPNGQTRAFHTDDAGVAAALAYIDTIDNDRFNIYTSMGLQATQPKKHARGGKADVSQIIGLWADLDAGKDGGYASSLVEAISIAYSMPLPATILLCSGHGAQAFWLFVEPLSLESDDERADADDLLKAWGATVVEYGRRLGFRVDSGVFDPSRVMRVPGTKNVKDPAAVADAYLIEIHESRRYNPSDIEQYLVEAPFEWNNLAVTPMTLDGIEVRPIDEWPVQVQVALQTGQNPDFVRTWDRQRTDLRDQSASGYCMALANFLASFALTDEQIVQTLCRWREEHHASRKDVRWYGRTLGKARASSQFDAERAAEIQRTDALVESTHEIEADDALAGLNAYMGVTIEGLFRIRRPKRSVYRVAINGQEYELGTPRDARDQSVWEDVLMEARQPYTRLKKDIWAKCDRLLRCAFVDVEDGDESTEAGRAHHWLREYLAATSTFDGTIKGAYLKSQPFIRDDGRICVWFEKLAAWVLGDRRYRGLDEAADIKASLRAMGAMKVRYDLKQKGVVAKRPIYYILPSDFIKDLDGDE